MPDPRVIAHRGASAHRPENTVAAFRYAVELGADWVELDVWAVDGFGLAVIHDHPASPVPAGVPTLAEALEACGSMGVNVEIKAAPVGDVAAVVRAWGGEVLVSSFDPGVVDDARAAGLPTAQLTHLLDRAVEDTVAWVAERGHRWWHPWFPLCDAEAIAAAHAAGLRVTTWTVDDPVRIADLASWGVDGIVTNDVPTALAVLGRKKLGGTASSSGD
jgi:glycerophosphoryl diester phosphodiesterase